MDRLIVSLIVDVSRSYKLKPKFDRNCFVEDTLASILLVILFIKYALPVSIVLRTILALYAYMTGLVLFYVHHVISFDREQNILGETYSSEFTHYIETITIFNKGVTVIWNLFSRYSRCQQTKTIDEL